MFVDSWLCLIFDMIFFDGLCVLVLGGNELALMSG